MTGRDEDSTGSTPLRAGVVGVGSMGENHARVYSELRGTELVGVADLNTTLAERVAETYGTEPMAFEELLSGCDVVSVAVPTAAHYDTVRACLEAGLDVLVEKPIAGTVEEARDLATHARAHDCVLQVGHVERFNPALGALESLVSDLEVIAVDAERLGPPVDRADRDDVVTDLMIHDVDVVGSLLDAVPVSVAATGTEDGEYATARLEYPDGVVASLTASRVTQKKVRRLTVTARECLVEVDYLEQSVLVYRDSFPEYVTDDGRSRYRHESVIERPRVENGEPLRRELESFLEAARTGTRPAVTAGDGLRALETVAEIERLAFGDDLEVRPR